MFLETNWIFSKYGEGVVNFRRLLSLRSSKLIYSHMRHISYEQTFSISDLFRCTRSRLVTADPHMQCSSLASACTSVFKPSITELVRRVSRDEATQADNHEMFVMRPSDDTSGRTLQK